MMIHVFILLFLFHNNDASLQFMKNVWSKTRICIGEGGYCPLNLPLKLPGCCKPFICKKVPKTHQPTIFARFADYIDTRCVDPSNITHSINMTYHGNGEPGILPSFNEERESKHKNITATFYTHGTNTMIGGNQTTVLQYSGNEFNDYKSTDVLPTVQLSTNTMYNDTDEQEGIEEHKFSLSEDNEQEKHGNKTFEKRAFSGVDVNNDSKEAVVMKTLENTTDYNKEYDNSSLDYSESFYSETSNSSDYDVYGGSNATTPNLVENLLMEINQTHNLTTIQDYLPINSTLASKTSSQNTSSEDIDEDWASSQMDYDRRPTLHKVVTILPFHLFSSVEVARINETIEGSE